ncbi:MAG: hypothetical protein WC254_07265, partial [Candidatus Woesearchaeota archaeon]
MRLVQRYGDLHTKPVSFESDDPDPTGEAIARIKKRIQEDPEWSKYFSLSCVRPAGLVVPGSGETRIISMQNAGKTLSRQLDDEMDTNKQRELYENALAILAKFHFISTTNLLRVKGICTPIPHLILRDGFTVPTLQYEQLITRRVVGSQEKPRLGLNRGLEEIMYEVRRIGDFLDRGCFGLVMQEPCEENIAESGLIDMGKLSLGNFLYDAARFLYGASFERKRHIDLHNLREHYIASLTGPVEETHNAKNPLSGRNYEESREHYSHFRTNTELIRCCMDYFLEHIRSEGVPSEVAEELGNDVISEFISRPLIESIMDWDCCRIGAAERMREFCQASAILVCMGETGALVYQLENERKRNDPVRKQYLETELRHAVRNSLAFMSYQGYSRLANMWAWYLSESGKIPLDYMVDDHNPVR